MRDKDFEEIMDSWADHETESAPEMHPTSGMYRLVQAKRKRSLGFLWRSRWSIAATAAASLVIVVLLYTVIFHPSIFLNGPSSQEIAWVGQREGFAAEGGVIVRGTKAPPDKGREKRGPVHLEQLLFQFQNPDSEFVEAFDLHGQPAETFSLSSADNYRLLLEPALDRYIYVFQLTNSSALVKLFPNETFSPVENPLRQGQSVYLPAEPNWFYLDEGEGEERIVIVASMRALQDLEDLYVRYSQADDESDKQKAFSGLLTKLKDLEYAHPAEVGSWELLFDHH
jgi:hypothetical protein